MKRFVPLLILCSLLVTLPKINTTEAEPKTIVVPDDYPTIQEAINNTDEGDTVFVKSGTYYNQTLIINKSLSLIGEDSKTTVLIGRPVVPLVLAAVIQMNANDVKISGFTIMNTFYCIIGNGDRAQIIGNIMTTTYDYGFVEGIAVHGSYKTIAENIISGGVVGIQGSGSYNNITGNTITGTGDRSIELYGSFNTVTGNNIRDHVGLGIQIYSGDSNTITKNNITDGSNGINIHNGSRNTVSENRVTGMAGQGISIGWGFDNTIYGNYIANNKWGAIIGGYECEAGNNTVYHNNFIDNTVQVRTDWIVYGVNHWDNGYPSGGNYWSDYNGTDLHSGSYQNMTGCDGIGDTPYVIETATNNTDRYPLMYPWSSLPVHNINTGLGYATIQEAKNAPETLDGHTIFVEAGTYYEHVVVNKTISLIGENRETTIIDGGGIITPIVHIMANNVTVRAFTIQNSGRIYGYEGGGIYITNSNRNNIVENTITNTQYGINLRNSTSNTIIGNTITENDVGIQFLDDYSSDSTIYHNNFIDNGWQVNSFATSNNTWDDGYPSGGNYWSDYEDRYPNATEMDNSGIWDTPYVIDENNQDNYPIIPEFPTWTSILFILIVLTVALAIYKRRLPKTPIR